MDTTDARGPVQQIEVGTIEVGNADPDGAAGAVAQLTKSLLPTPSEVSIVVLRGTEVQTVAATSAVARVLDGWQARTGQGPCLQAAASLATVYAADLRTETRWPRWTRHSVDAGARSVLSLGLRIDDTVTGALNVYTTLPGAFPDAAAGLPQSLAAHAATVLRTIYRYDTQAANVRYLQATLAHRTVIEQARGIIMGDRRCTPDEAYAVLVTIAQDSNRKVHEAAAILTHGVANTARSVPGPATTPSSPPNAAVPPAQFTTDVDQDGVAVIGVIGELVMDTADELLAAITAALSAHPVTRVVVDLARVSLLDMAALSDLLRGRTVALRAGASFRAVRPQPLVRQVLHLTDTCLLLTAAPPAVEQPGPTPPRTTVGAVRSV